MSRGPYWANRLWQLASLPESWAFHHGNLRFTQEKILRQLLDRQAGTPFGQRHQLSTITTYQDFKDRVPLSTYDTLLPYLPAGLSQETVRVWEPTGGSSGGSKWIPWTPTLQRQFRRAVAVWIFHLFRQYPKARDGRSYWQLTPKTGETAKPEWLHDQTTGFASDGEYLGPLGRWLERSILIAPSAGGDFWRGTVEALRQASDLRLISCWSPSFLLCLHDRCLEHAGEWNPREWWPNLQLLSCWTQGPSATYLPKLQELFPATTIQPKGLLSTEAVVTIPIGKQAPLAYRSHVFELASEGTTVPSWQMESGQEGTIIVTTGGGLTRYSTGDRVRVTGFLGQIPCLEFLGREGVADQRGEKLALSFVEPLLEDLEGFSMLAFEGEGYVLFFDRTVAEVVRRRQTIELEQRFLSTYTYRDCRQLGQLRPLRGFLIEGDALMEYTRICSESLGQREGGAKALRYHPYQGWSQAFTGRFLQV